MLLKAIRALYSRNGLAFKESVVTVAVSRELLWEVARANECAKTLDGRFLGEFVPVDMIDIDLADEGDDALDVMCDAEDSVRKILVANVIGGEQLDKILEAAFDGALRAALSE